MIYITKKYVDRYGEVDTYINNLFFIGDNSIDPKEQYNEFLLEKSKELDLVINPHWYNPMNYEDHNPHISKTSYKKKCKEWERFLLKYDIDKFIENNLGGKKLDYKEIR